MAVLVGPLVAGVAGVAAALTPQAHHPQLQLAGQGAMVQRLP